MVQNFPKLGTSPISFPKLPRKRFLFSFNLSERRRTAAGRQCGRLHFPIPTATKIRVSLSGNLQRRARCTSAACARRRATGCARAGGQKVAQLSRARRRTKALARAAGGGVPFEASADMPSLESPAPQASTSSSRTMSQTHWSSKCQEALKGEEKKRQSQDAVKQNSRFEITPTCY